MQIITCPHCEYPNELMNFVPQPGASAEACVCERCEQAFTFRLDELVELPDTAATAADTHAA